jgi:Glycosyl transferase family 2
MASVIIIFTGSTTSLIPLIYSRWRISDEAWSVLMRTVHPVVNRSHSSLLKEVLLVDDMSQRQELGAPLDEYITRFHGLVRVVRSRERLGLIRAKRLVPRRPEGRLSSSWTRIARLMRGGRLLSSLFQ